MPKYPNAIRCKTVEDAQKAIAEWKEFFCVGVDIHNRLYLDDPFIFTEIITTPDQADDGGYYAQVCYPSGHTEKHSLIDMGVLIHSLDNQHRVFVYDEEFYRLVASVVKKQDYPQYCKAIGVDEKKPSKWPITDSSWVDPEIGWA